MGIKLVNQRGPATSLLPTEAEIEAAKADEVDRLEALSIGRPHLRIGSDSGGQR